MNWRFLQKMKNAGVGRSGFLIVLFLLLPYCVDAVASLGDFTPTHFAQENINDGKEVDPSAEKASLLPPLDQAGPIDHRLGQRLLVYYAGHSDHAFKSSQSLFAFFLTSRPPPIL